MQRKEGGPIALMALQDRIYEESGKVAGVRVLSDTGVEVSFQGVGKVLGENITFTTLLTTVGTRHPDGAVVLAGNGIATTENGDSINIKTLGVRRPTGRGLKSSGRGLDIFQTASQRFAGWNNRAYLWEVETDEVGNYQLSLWEWK